MSDVCAVVRASQGLFGLSLLEPAHRRVRLQSIPSPLSVSLSHHCYTYPIHHSDPLQPIGATYAGTLHSDTRLRRYHSRLLAC